MKLPIPASLEASTGNADISLSFVSFCYATDPTGISSYSSCKKRDTTVSAQISNPMRTLKFSVSKAAHNHQSPLDLDQA
jgi:hypothetical protein